MTLMFATWMKCSYFLDGHAGNHGITNLHYYRVELFYVVTDLQHMELENRFGETATELLISMVCLNPITLFLLLIKAN